MERKNLLIQCQTYPNIRNFSLHFVVFFFFRRNQSFFCLFGQFVQVDCFTFSKSDALQERQKTWQNTMSKKRYFSFNSSIFIIVMYKFIIVFDCPLFFVSCTYNYITLKETITKVKENDKNVNLFVQNWLIICWIGQMKSQFNLQFSSSTFSFFNWYNFLLLLFFRSWVFVFRANDFT